MAYQSRSEIAVAEITATLNDGSTVRAAVEYWLAFRRTEVKSGTWSHYRQVARYIVEPLLVGSRTERCAYSRHGIIGRDSHLLEMLGAIPLSELSTAQIRQWHRTLSLQVGAHTAKVAKKILRSVLLLVAEDFDIRVPTMPSNRGRGRPQPRKCILVPSQVGQLLEAALKDERKGIYYAFPFLTGVRPSEQLALLWDDIDFDRKVVRICRVQERDGSLTPLTKTAAGTRDVPMPQLLEVMLRKWQTVCPVLPTGPARVFPGLGRSSHATYIKRGQALSYMNFLIGYWRPAFNAAGLPYVTPHSARHSYISTLQAQGVEIGLVAKLAGHANPAVTISHYTQAVRGGDAAVAVLVEAYTGTLF